MKILNKIKNYFSSDVKLEDEELNQLVYEHPLKSGCFVIGADLIVPENLIFISVIRHKPMDILMPGEYQISPTTLPLAFKKSKTKLNDGKGKTKFNGSGYFVNKNYEKTIVVTSYRKMTERYLEKFDYTFTLDIKFKIESPKTLFKNMRFVTYHIDDIKIANFISTRLSQVLTDLFDKQHLNAVAYETCNQLLLDLAEKEIDDVLEFLGLIKTNFELKFNVKSLDKKSKTNKKENKNKTNNLKTQENDLQNSKELLEAEDYKDIDDFEKQIEDRDEVNVFDSEAFSTKNNTKNIKDLVDLSLENLYDTKCNVVCPYCKEKNREMAVVCYKCGRPLEKKEQFASDDTASEVKEEKGDSDENN